ncbi:MAG: aspartate--tRNA(Asn) ligase [Candidatus Parcubacteria bacterium]|nr:aspartate--tRNA(Asn) ligase [Candidatus Parcubacteria bacterium]
MERILNSETPKHIGEKVRIAGWMTVRRDHGGIVFFDLRDRSGIIQVVSSSELAKDINNECVLEIKGEIKKRPDRMVNPELETGNVELKAEEIKIVSKAEVLPFDLVDMKMTLPSLLDWRPLTLRNKKIQAIFKVQEEIISSFRRTLSDLGFTEFQAPTLVPGATEGGSEVFHVDYFKYNAYLAQSPQFYKQILIGVFERVFTITRVYRAEPSVTTRHICEFVSLDAEMGFINSWEDLMDVCETILKNMVADLQKNRSKELAMYGNPDIQIGQKIPRLRISEIQEIIFKTKGRDNRGEMDLTPEDEKDICLWAKENHGSEAVFATHFPGRKRPFYTFPDPENPLETLSFDLLYKGLEVVTGGQRINEYKMLEDNIKKWGNKPKDFEFYLQAFKYGMPPEGGFAWGSERITKQILGLENIREATLFPRDMERIDQRLSILQPKKAKKPKK